MINSTFPIGSVLGRRIKSRTRVKSLESKRNTEYNTPIAVNDDKRAKTLVRTRLADTDKTNVYGLYKRFFFPFSRAVFHDDNSDVENYFHFFSPRLRKRKKQITPTEAVIVVPYYILLLRHVKTHAHTL